MTQAVDAVLTERDEVQLSKFFTVTPTALVVKGRPSLEQFESLGEVLRVFEKSTAFCLGDFANAGEGLYGEEFAQVLDAERYSEATVKVYRWVSAKVAPVNRRPDLDFAHHQEIAALEASQQKLWLERAATGDGDGKPWSAARLRRELRAADRGDGPSGGNYGMLVECESSADRDAFARQLDNLGRTKYKRTGEKD